VTCAEVGVATQRGDRGQKAASTRERATLGAGVAGGLGQALVPTSRLVGRAKGHCSGVALGEPAYLFGEDRGGRWAATERGVGRFWTRALLTVV